MLIEHGVPARPELVMQRRVPEYEAQSKKKKKQEKSRENILYRGEVVERAPFSLMNVQSFFTRAWDIFFIIIIVETIVIPILVWKQAALIIIVIIRIRGLGHCGVYTPGNNIINANEVNEKHNYQLK